MLCVRRWCTQPWQILQQRSIRRSTSSTSSTSRINANIIQIEDATFYRHNDLEGQPLFSHVNFALDSTPSMKSQWAIISPSSISRTTFLQVLAGQHVVVPPSARTYPALSQAGISPLQAIKYVGFDADRGSRIGGTSLRGAYLSARYESRREETDFSVRDYLAGHTELNALEKDVDGVELDTVIRALNLSSLADMPVSDLSNGQTRRARIAKALMDKPQVLLLDGPFMGLDPKALQSVSQVLKSLAEQQYPRLVISLRPKESVPDWVGHLIVIDETNRVVSQGDSEAVMAQSLTDKDNTTASTWSWEEPELGEALIEMSGVQVTYQDKIVLGDWQAQQDGQVRSGLWWSLHRGQRCGIFGVNGSGKTTMLSLITSDHPQAYSLPIKIFGRSRLPQPGVPGISVFDLQKRMGHSSPEVHAFFPRQLTVRRALESAWADAPLARPMLDADATSRVDAFLDGFAEELYKAGDVRFGELSFSSQRLLLFLRAIIAQPDLIILDEAFSGMDEAVRDKAFALLSHAQTSVDRNVFKGLNNEQALLVVSHAKEDVPGCVREWICLPEPASGCLPRTGRLSEPLQHSPGGWNQIWEDDHVCIKVQAQTRDQSCSA